MADNAENIDTFLARMGELTDVRIRVQNIVCQQYEQFKKREVAERQKRFANTLRVTDEMLMERDRMWRDYADRSLYLLIRHLNKNMPSTRRINLPERAEYENLANDDITPRLVEIDRRFTAMETAMEAQAWNAYRAILKKSLPTLSEATITKPTKTTKTPKTTTTTTGVSSFNDPSVSFPPPIAPSVVIPIGRATSPSESSVERSPNIDNTRNCTINDNNTSLLFDDIDSLDFDLNCPYIAESDSNVLGTFKINCDKNYEECAAVLPTSATQDVIVNNSSTASQERIATTNSGVDSGGSSEHVIEPSSSVKIPLNSNGTSVAYKLNSQPDILLDTSDIRHRKKKNPTSFIVSSSSAAALSSSSSSDEIRSRDGTALQKKRKISKCP